METGTDSTGLDCRCLTGQLGAEGPRDRWKVVSAGEFLMGATQLERQACPYSTQGNREV